MRRELEERRSPKNMEIIDANVIQKYILNDDEVLSEKAARVVGMENVTTTYRSDCGSGLCFTEGMRLKLLIKN